MRALPSRDNDAALDFLKKLYPDGPWVLTAIRPERKGIDTDTFASESDPELLTFLNEHNGSENLYYAVNPLLAATDKKAKRTDVKEVAYLHIDLDAQPVDPKDPECEQKLKEELARIWDRLTTKRPGTVPEPTAVIFSGGGYQALWKLETPIPINGDSELAEDVKRYNMQLELLFEADKCHNIDRILRLPGTINVPNESKRKKGRKPECAKLLFFDPDRVYPIAAFQPTPAKRVAPALGVNIAASARDDSVEQLGEVDFLDQWKVPERLKIIIQNGNHPDEPKEGDNSRSVWVFDCLCQLLRARIPEPLIRGILLDPRYRISESILEKRCPMQYALRQIENAKNAVALDEMEFQLEKGKGLPVANSQHNVRLALYKMGVSVRYDQFQNKALIEGVLGHGPYLDDPAMNRLWLELDEMFNFRPTKEFFWTVVQDAARRSSFHPVRDYLDGLVWDGLERLDGWLTTYAGAEDNEYTRAIGALVLVAAVRRVVRPGCKFDEMLVLESSQGTNKSSALRALAVRDEWFTDDLPLNAESKIVIERLAGRWIVEAGELKGMRASDVEHLKALLSRQHDTARLAYERMPVQVPRQCIIVGTTNSDRYLNDSTGNRRFWPVKIEAFDLERLTHDRDQLWAEAVAREAQQSEVRLNTALWTLAATEQEARRLEDPFVDVIRQALGDKQGKIKIQDIWEVVEVPRGQRTNAHEKRIGEAMRELGWSRKKMRFGRPNPEWSYVKGPSPHAKLVLVDQAGRYVVEYAHTAREIADPF
jgi:hypothetical protein